LEGQLGLAAFLVGWVAEIGPRKHWVNCVGLVASLQVHRVRGWLCDALGAFLRLDKEGEEWSAAVSEIENELWECVWWESRPEEPFSGQASFFFFLFSNVALPAPI
jgi:hypothetical protein